VSQAAIQRLKERFPDAVAETYEGVGGDDVALVRKERIQEVCRFLKDDPALKFDMAPYITAADYLGSEPRFDVVYQLYSTVHNHRIRLRVGVPADDAVVPTVATVWKGADWYERYCWDMYGIRFDGHPDPRRLYMYEEFEGHPLRKDYSLRGRQPLMPERHVDENFRGPGPAGRD
jgi:NADH-quinone oxidoreductase subunit C